MKLITKTLLITITFLPTLFFAQTNHISGIIKDKNTNEALPYVNLGIRNEEVGTVSRGNGAFKLQLNIDRHQNDSIIFSHIGFKTLIIPIKNLSNNDNTILLEQEIDQLNEVTLKKAKTPKQKKIGITSTGLGLIHMNYYSSKEKEVDDRLSRERGMKLNIKKNCQINSLNFHVSSNFFKSVKFRVNFYKIENDLPTEILVNKNIIFEITKGQTGWISVDLKPYDIYLEETTGEIGVTIQWVESEKWNEKSKFFSISANKSPLRTILIRDKSMGSWKKEKAGLSLYLDSMCN